MQCSILNGMVFGLSLLFFEYVLLPSLSMIMGHFLSSGEEDSRVWMHVQPVLSALFNMFWVMPIFVLSRIINTIWFQVRKRILKNYYFCVHVLRFLCVSKLEISILFCLCQDNLRHICLSILSALFPQFFFKSYLIHWKGTGQGQTKSGWKKKFPLVARSCKRVQ